MLFQYLKDLGDPPRILMPRYMDFLSNWGINTRDKEQICTTGKIQDRLRIHKHRDSHGRTAAAGTTCIPGLSVRVTENTQKMFLMYGNHPHISQVYPFKVKIIVIQGSVGLSGHRHEIIIFSRFKNRACWKFDPAIFQLSAKNTKKIPCGSSP